ncbi:MAG: ABC transporter permease subunit [Dehalococcoidia bacterium]
MTAETGSAIYDLGYARYIGTRGGRYAVLWSLYVFSLRSVFGLGRRNSSKIVPVALTVVTFIPAGAQLGIAALATNVIEIFRPEAYYGFINWTLALFVAATSTDLVGRDRSSQVLALYFARGLRRDDYVAAKYAAGVTSLLALTLLPQALLFVGNGLAVEDVMGYLRRNWGDIPPIAGSAIGLSFYLASLGLVAASLTPRRSFAAGAIVGYFAISGAVAAAAVEFGGRVLSEWTPLVSAFHVLSGSTYWIFDAEPSPDGVVGKAGLALGWYAVTLAAVSVGGVLLLIRSYRRLRL